jgi:hypothetical protein
MKTAEITFLSRRFKYTFEATLINKHSLNPTEVNGENVFALRAGVRIPVDPTDFVLMIV